MNILFIGGTGNLSAACAAHLHNRGHQIWVIGRGTKPVPPQFHLLRADRADRASMGQALRTLQFDAVLNFLGFEPADVEIDYELLHGRIGQYLFISSATVYAKPHTQLPITEEAPLGNPFWEYAQKKLQCEEWLRQRHQDAGFPVTIVRPSHTYSPSWIPNPISSSSYDFAARLQSGRPVFIPDQGETPWTLTTSADFAVGLGGLVGRREAVGEAFHITSDEALPWKRIYLEISNALGVSSPAIVPIPTAFICRVAPQLTGPLRGDKANPAVFDNSKIKRFVPEFQGRTPFALGVRDSVRYLRDHPEERRLKPEIDATFENVINAWQASY